MDFTPFVPTTDADVLKAVLFNRSRLNEKTGCWEWIAASTRNGYGLITRDGKTQSAHRVSYEAYCGPIPTGLKVLHSCDNPACINPMHLRAGTQKENVDDRQSRGRHWGGCGERIGTSKLTEAQVIEIKTSLMPVGQLSKKYGVDASQIWNIITNKSWEHLARYQIERPTYFGLLKGSQIGSSKLDELQVTEIFLSPSSITDLAEKYGVHRTAIKFIRQGRTWSQVTAGLVAPERLKCAVGAKHHAAKLTAEQAAEIRASTLKGVELSAKYGVSQGIISAIKCGRIWKDVCLPRQE